MLTYGEQPYGVVTLKRRYGPRRLRDDDDVTQITQILSKNCFSTQNFTEIGLSYGQKRLLKPS